MFTFYQNINARREENELQREAEFTGHDRFCQQRPGAANRRKRRGVASRRTQSAIEIECNNDAFASVRSVLLRKEKSASVEEEESAQSPTPHEEPKGYYQLTSKIDSLAKLFFSRVYGVKGSKEQTDGSRNNGRQQYMALEQHQPQGEYIPEEASTASTSTATPNCSPETLEMEKRSRDRALSICRIYTRETSRYSLLKHLNNVGSRVEKHWFAVRDTLIKTERLLTLAPLNRNCMLNINPMTRDVLNKLFLMLQHPYILPILDLEFVQFENDNYVLLVQPINEGSLKDIIYGIERSCWNENWILKYGNLGKGLQISQIQRMGRQILEALVFLKERDFPTVSHLHSGNVIVQNGVARLAALENSLLGFTSRIYPLVASRLHDDDNQLVPQCIDTICFGHMLFEMTAGYELRTFEPTATNLLDIKKYPQVLDCLRFIFEGQTPGSKFPNIEELILHDLFRNIDLREMRNASINIFRPDTTIPISRILDGIKCQKPPIKRVSNIESEDMISLSSPESERKENSLLLAQLYKELTITSV